MYKDEYGKYDYPSNLQSDAIKNDIYSFKRRVTLDDQKYFDYILEILNGRFNSLDKISEELKRFPKVAKRTEAEAYNKMNTIPKIVYCVGQRGKSVKKKYLEEKNFNVKAVLYGKAGSDKDFSRVDSDLTKDWTVINSQSYL